MEERVARVIGGRRNEKEGWMETVKGLGRLCMSI